ncbi:uncharacterized protein LOC121928691 isoform X1 [Sceloporus undulatus]|uniref:uncharacterized protein LOC121928691 isoform X1 n=1 Tax=Sceloporus undulatus TaxID=8520 RepID=UPI001C4C3474|nr:uncharacterized protein LOC121928691 isoform X1 [Sceloporus undulatus]
MDARLRSSLEAELSCRYIPTRKQYQRRGLPMCREGISKRPLPENSRRSRLGSGERSGLEEEEDRRRCLLLLPDHQHPASTSAMRMSDARISKGSYFRGKEDTFGVHMAPEKNLSLWVTSSIFWKEAIFLRLVIGTEDSISKNSSKKGFNNIFSEQFSRVTHQRDHLTALY